ncbi:WYL domain-containing protein [Lutimonas vermicola]|uniref:WYL domain-containing protein n=1 Tax=Lutimonas vermicola TaxID=414288 RepID=A0ABU9KXC0_9FLAO
MSKYLQFRRYQFIIEKLKSKAFTSFEEINETLDQHDIRITKRTLQRDLQTIRNEFLIEIPYDRKHNGYYIDYEESLLEDIESFVHFLEIVNTADLLVNNLEEGKNNLRHISFDSIGNLRGIHILKPVLQAIRDQSVITFDHLSYQTGDITRYSIKPYGLRESLNRWYVVGIAHGEDDFWKFGIDRIKNLNITTETFVRDPNKDPHKIFEQVIGVEISDKELQPVILSFDPQQGKYIKSLKLHRSQKILLDNKEEVRIEIKVKPNFELIQNILMHGSLVTVLEPEWLVTKIKRILHSALRKYNE